MKHSELHEYMNKLEQEIEWKQFILEQLKKYDREHYSCGVTVEPHKEDHETS